VPLSQVPGELVHPLAGGCRGEDLDVAELQQLTHRLEVGVTDRHLAPLVGDRPDLLQPGAEDAVGQVDPAAT
jgi:hypothetical protein